MELRSYLLSSDTRTSGMTRNWGVSPQLAADRADSNSQRKLSHSNVVREVGGETHTG